MSAGAVPSSVISMREASLARPPGDSVHSPRRSDLADVRSRPFRGPATRLPSRPGPATYGLTE